MQLETLLEASARAHPEREALSDGARRIAFGALEAEANRLAHTLGRLGVRRGDRVAIWLDNSIELVVALFATLKAGGCFVVIGASTRPAKLAELVDHARARALVLPSARLEALAGELAARPHLAALVAVGHAPATVPAKAWVRFAEATAPGAAAEVAPDKRHVDLDLAALLYTSGSSGEPKGVMLTHGNVMTATRSIASYLRLGSDDVLYLVLPLSFGYGLTQLFTALAVGARLVIDRGISFPHQTLGRMRDEGATGVAIVPTTAALLLRLDLGAYGLPLRYLTCAGGALPPTQALRLHQALPGVDIIPMYGQTECLRVSYLEPAELAARPGSVGRGMPNQELFVVDGEGREVGPDELGELVVRGAHVMRGYWDDAEETARKLRPLHPTLCAEAGIDPGERMLYTGDLFRRDRDGYLYFVSRRDRIIKSRGQKVGPQEVERVLHALPGVVEAAVMGTPHPVYGEAIKAIVVLEPEVKLTVQQVRRHCADRLEDHMVPDLVEFRPALAKNERGKVVLS